MDEANTVVAFEWAKHVSRRTIEQPSRYRVKEALPYASRTARRNQGDALSFRIGRTDEVRTEGNRQLIDPVDVIHHE